MQGPCQAACLPAALNVGSVIEDEINREFTDLDNLKVQDRPEPSISCVSVQDRSQLLHMGELVLELQGCEAAVLSFRSQDEG
jgi:hypothetical protein